MRNNMQWWLGHLRNQSYMNPRKKKKKPWRSMKMILKMPSVACLRTPPHQKMLLSQVPRKANRWWKSCHRQALYHTPTTLRSKSHQRRKIGVSSSKDSNLWSLGSLTQWLGPKLSRWLVSTEESWLLESLERPITWSSGGLLRMEGQEIRAPNTQRQETWEKPFSTSRNLKNSSEAGWVVIKSLLSVESHRTRQWMLVGQRTLD